MQEDMINRSCRQKFSERDQRKCLLPFLPGGGVLLRILGGAVPPSSSDPDPISDQKCNFRL